MGLVAGIDSSTQSTKVEVRDAADGEIVTVDGHLGIVTVGPPEFDLELS